MAEKVLESGHPNKHIGRLDGMRKLNLVQTDKMTLMNLQKMISVDQ